MNKCFNSGAEKKLSPHLKRAPFKYLKWTISTQIDHSAIFTQLCPELLYTQNE